MAKFYGNSVKKGKLGGSVFAIRYGETIERQYQPSVSNPSTPLQVQSRAKLKLLSQLSAVMAPVIAIPRNGAVSARNMFTKKNYSATSYAGNNADIELLDVKLTESVVALPPIRATHVGNQVTAELTASVTNLSRVVYAMFVTIGDGSLRYVKSEVVETPGVGFNYQVEVNVGTSNPVYVYAYGVRDNNDKARATFADMTIVSAEEVARVIVTRVLSGVDVTLTETKAALAAAE